MTPEHGTLGFVGLGAMGTPIVEELLEAGHELVVYDRVPAAVERAVARGAVAAESAVAVADAADTVFVSLPRPDVVRAVAVGRERSSRARSPPRSRSAASACSTRR